MKLSLTLKAGHGRLSGNFKCKCRSALPFHKLHFNFKLTFSLYLQNGHPLSLCLLTQFNRFSDTKVNFKKWHHKLVSHKIIHDLCIVLTPSGTQRLGICNTISRCGAWALSQRRLISVKPKKKTFNHYQIFEKVNEISLHKWRGKSKVNEQFSPFSARSFDARSLSTFLPNSWEILSSVFHSFTSPPCNTSKIVKRFEWDWTSTHA